MHNQTYPTLKGSNREQATDISILVFVVTRRPLGSGSSHRPGVVPLTLLHNGSLSLRPMTHDGCRHRTVKVFLRHHTSFVGIDGRLNAERMEQFLEPAVGLAGHAVQGLHQAPPASSADRPGPSGGLRKSAWLRHCLRSCAARARARGPRCVPAAPVAVETCNGGVLRTSPQVGQRPT